MVSDLKNPLFMRFFLLRHLPMALFAGLRVRQVDDEKCVVSVPFKYLNKNPFKSMYFAVQSMAAEFSTALLLVDEIQRSKADLALIIVSMKAEFISRARDRTTFTCVKPGSMKELINRAISSEEAQVVELITKGHSAGGEQVSEFTFIWSVKRRG